MLPLKKKDNNSNLSCSGNIGSSHSGCFHSEHLSYRSCGCLKEKSNDGFTALICHYISASIPKKSLNATVVATETVFGRIRAAGTVQTDFLLMFRTYGPIIDFASETVWVSVKNTVSIYLSLGRHFRCSVLQKHVSVTALQHLIFGLQFRCNRTIQTEECPLLLILNKDRKICAKTLQTVAL